MLHADIVIIGAGPAGIAAAHTLAEAGKRPMVIDEARYAGGQIFRQAEPLIDELDQPHRYGLDGRRAKAFRRRLDNLTGKVTFRSDTLVWSIEQNKLQLVRGDRIEDVRFEQIVLATGAMDRILPFEGWTIPGVFSLGAAQIALKAQASLIGRKVVFVGTGPLLYLVAYQYLRSGADVIEVLDSNDPLSNVTALPDLGCGGLTFLKGLYYLAHLKVLGVSCRANAVPVRAEWQDERVGALVYRHKGREILVSCDAVASGYGLKPETQLADMLGLDFKFDGSSRQWLPAMDDDGRTSVDGVYLAGDGSLVRGSQVAELAGELAALSLLADQGMADPDRQTMVKRKIARANRFRNALDDRIFPFPHTLAAGLPDDVVVCRCENLDARTIRHTVHRFAEVDVNRVKAFCRLGMGRCQGRLCGSAAAEIIAASGECDISIVGRLRGQAPVKPVSLSVLAGGRL